MNDSIPKAEKHKCMQYLIVIMKLQLYSCDVILSL